LIIHRPIEAWKTYPQHVWKEFCDPDILRGNTGTFTHLPGVVHIFDRFIHFFDTFHDSNSKMFLTIVPPDMWKMWKTYPPKLWINRYSHACYVHMWKTYPPRLWINHASRLYMWKAWKIYPPKLWISDCLFACYVHMWKTCPPRLWINRPDGSHQIILKDNMWKVWKTYPHKMWINR